MNSMIEYFKSIYGPKFVPDMEILIDNLEEDEVDYWETYYIDYYTKLLGSEMVLNDDKGGKFNKQRSDDFKKKMSDIITKLKGVPVRKYTIDGEYICSYKNMTDASNDNGIDYRNLQKAVHGSKNTCGGFRWYPDDGKVYPIIYYNQYTPPKNEYLLELFNSNFKKYKYINMTYIFQVDLNTDVILAVYPSIKQASISSGVSQASIDACINNLTKRAGKYKWYRIDYYIRTYIY